MTKTSIIRARLFGSTALACLALAGAAHAATGAADGAAATSGDAAAVSEVVVTMARETRSSVEIDTQTIQKMLPGVSPLKAIQTLPGVLFETADPWGNNEQNEALFVHGFSTQQLGYTMDGVPLGDQQYGNYNGLVASRAVSSENVDRVMLSSGAGSLGVASTSNLGGAIETFSRDPVARRGRRYPPDLGQLRHHPHLPALRHRRPGQRQRRLCLLPAPGPRAWDFDGHQRDDQVNLKFVHDDADGKLTLFADWQSKVEPNEDATAFGNQQTAAAAGFTPYTRPFLYPNLAACSSR